MIRDAVKNIALFGRSGSGKGEVAKILAAERHYSIASSGRICRRISQIIYGNEERKNLNSISSAIRTIDPAIFINSALRDVPAERRVVFDSIRYPSDYDWFRDNGFSLWHVYCPPSVCLQRLRRRGQAFQLSDLEHETESSLADREYDVIIDNYNRNVEQLRTLVILQCDAAV